MLTLVVLLVLPSPVRASACPASVAGRACGRRSASSCVARPCPRRELSLVARRAPGRRRPARRAARRAAWPAVVLASALVVVGHTRDVPARRPDRRVDGVRPRACCRWRCWCSSRWRARQRRRLGSARGRRRVGRSPPPAWAPRGRRDRRRLRRHGARRRACPGRWCSPWHGPVRALRAENAASLRLRPASASRRRGRFVAERPYTLLSCGISIDGYLDGADRGAAPALQRRRPRPRRRRARRLRRDPRRRGHRPQRQPPAAGARAGAPRRPGGAGSAAPRR